MTTRAVAWNKFRRVTGGLIELGKPRITLFVMITTAVGFYLAPGEPHWRSALAAVLGTGLLVAAANTLNCFIERRSDAQMPRTAGRVLPSGRLSPSVALASGVFWAAVAVPLLHWSTNPLTAMVGLAALLVYVLAYTPLKRVSPVALEVGALAGALPPLMGWTAAQNSVGGPAIALFAILFFWQLPHFYALSLMYCEDYRRGGIRTLAIVRGREVVLKRMSVSAMGLVVASLAAIPAGIGGSVYAMIASVLGGGFIAVTTLAGREAAELRWSRRTFFYSLLYLPLLLGAMLGETIL